MHLSGIANTTLELFVGLGRTKQAKRAAAKSFGKAKFERCVCQKTCVKKACKYIAFWILNIFL
jgi:hypothetical protein